MREPSFRACFRATLRHRLVWGPALVLTLLTGALTAVIAYPLGIAGAIIMAPLGGITGILVSAFLPLDLHMLATAFGFAGIVLGFIVPIGLALTLGAVAGAAIWGPLGLLGALIASLWRCR